MTLVGRDHHEVIVATIWRDIIGLDPVDLDEDFFVAGGDSLTATIFVSKLSTRVAGDLSLEDFFASPTPRGIAAKLRGCMSAAGEGVVSMRAEGSGQPLILLPVGARMGFLAADIFDRHVWALEPIGLHRGVIGPIDLMTLAPLLADKIVRLGGERPTQLIGRCAGSLLALATGAELERRRTQVSAIHLFDPPPEVERASIDELTAIWVEESLPTDTEIGDEVPRTPEELFAVLRSSGVDVLSASREQFARRVGAVVATQHAAMQYAASAYRAEPVACPVYAYLSTDSPLRHSFPEEIYGGLTIRPVFFGIPARELFTASEVPTTLAQTMTAVDGTTGGMVSHSRLP